MCLLDLPRKARLEALLRRQPLEPGDTLRDTDSCPIRYSGLGFIETGAWWFDAATPQPV